MTTLPAKNTDSQVRTLVLEALDALPDPIFVITERGRYAALVGGQDRGFYHDGSSLVGRSVYDILAQHKARWFIAEIEKTLTSDQVRVVEYSLASVDMADANAGSGPVSTTWFEAHIQPLRQKVGGERAVAWHVRNIDARHALEVELRRESRVDELTGIANRRCFIGRLEELLHDYDPDKSQIAVVLLDIDRFRTVNDRHGRGSGDDLLCTFTRICDSRIKRRDLLARVGGEQFALLLYDTSVQQAAMVAERVRESVASETVRLDTGRDLRMTVSVGVSAAAPRRRRASDLMSHADAALYKAKLSGRNRVIVADM